MALRLGGKFTRWEECASGVEAPGGRLGLVDGGLGRIEVCEFGLLRSGVLLAEISEN